MKKYMYIIVAVLVGAAVSFGFANKGSAKVLNVNEIGSDPAAFSGVITITGIMAGVSPADKSIIGIMDLKELQCQSPNCNKVVIPVKYPGAQPAVGDELKVTGSFVKFDQGYLFQADKLKVVQSHKIGG